MSRRSASIRCRGANCGRSCIELVERDGLSRHRQHVVHGRSRALRARHRAARRPGARDGHAGGAARARERAHLHRDARAPASRRANCRLRLMQQPDVIDAVPQGGRVRVVSCETSRTRTIAPRSAHRAALASLEDGFMVLLRRTTRSHEPDAAGDSRGTAPHPRRVARRESSRSGSERGRHRGARSRAQVRRLHRGRSTRASRCIAARSSDCSDRTAPARRRRFACSAACCRRPAAPCAWPARTCARARRGAAAHRLRRAEVLALRRSERAREPRVLRRRVRSAQVTPARAH